MKTLLFLGGHHHDFEGFCASIKPLLQDAGCNVTESYDSRLLTRLATDEAELIVQYTSRGDSERDGEIASDLTAQETQAVVDWVEAGGGLVSVHCATVIGENNQDLVTLHGGRFLRHPAQFSFTVYPLTRAHPITEGIEPFTVFDELYYQDVQSDVAVHMVAIDRGRALPMLWTRTQGAGRVVHVATGHSDRVWSLPDYRQLITQSVEWAVGKR